jgi:hypothetical protein
MTWYRLAGQEFEFLPPVPELEPFKITEIEQGTAEKAVLFVKQPILKSNTAVPLTFPRSLICQTIGWVGSAYRHVKVYKLLHGTLLEVEGGGEFFITQDRHTIGKVDSHDQLTRLDYEILVGSVITLALALRGVWSLHSSAAIYKGNLIVILGESGHGKSTLAAFLKEGDWQLVSDDILPVNGNQAGITAWPHYPQLKIHHDSQPWLHVPEQFPVKKICLLSPAGKEDIPRVKLLTPGETAKVLLAHTAGTRLFNPDLLRSHLAFCSQSAGQVPAYRLTYPHIKEALPLSREILENL